MKRNLIVRNERGRVVEYYAGKGPEVAEWSLNLPDGYDIEATNDCYIERWGKWWNVGPCGENNVEEK